MVQDFPDAPELVTPEWLAGVLGTDELEVTDAYPVGTGQMARSHRFELGSASVVCKFPSSDAATRELGARAYRREVAFYRNIGQAAGARVPDCHFAAISDDGQRFVLVLEDLAPATPGNQITGCSIDQAMSAVQNLARLHAATWDAEGIADPSWLLDDRSIPLGDYMAMALPDFVERFSDRITPAAMDVFRGFADHADVWAESHPPSLAVVHGDYRLDNLLFHPQDGSVAAVDWQTVSLGNPGRDLAYFLGNSVTVEDRRTHERGLVDAYLETLEAHGVERYGRDQCWRDLRHGSFQGPLVTMLGAFTAIRTERGEEMFTAMAERCAAQILDLTALALLD